MAIYGNSCHCNSSRGDLPYFFYENRKQSATYLFSKYYKREKMITNKENYMYLLLIKNPQNINDKLFDKISYYSNLEVIKHLIKLGKECTTLAMDRASKNGLGEYKWSFRRCKVLTWK